MKWLDNFVGYLTAVCLMLLAISHVNCYKTDLENVHDVNVFVPKRATERSLSSINLKVLYHPFLCFS